MSSLQVADKIADAGFTVVLPDFVRGDYMDNDMSKFGAWAGKHSFDDEIKPSMDTVIAHLKEGGSTVSTCTLLYLQQLIVVFSI
jgi:dienelactone hydrolase